MYVVGTIATMLSLQHCFVRYYIASWPWVLEAGLFDPGKDSQLDLPENGHTLFGASWISLAGTVL